MKLKKIKVKSKVAGLWIWIRMDRWKQSVIFVLHDPKLLLCHLPSAQRRVSRIIKKESDHSEAFSSLKRFKKETSRPGNGAKINETKKL